MTASVSNYTYRGVVRGAGCVPNSILRIGPSNVPDKGRVCMALKVYLDSSGKPETESITLSGIVGTDELWAEFEPVWKEALDDNDVPMHRDGYRRFHMAALFARDRGYEGWDVAREKKLFLDLFNVLGKFRGTRLCAYSCTVMMEGYRRAKKEFPVLRKAEAICVNHCIGGIALTPEEKEPSRTMLELYFDHNETFLDTINRIWQKEHKQPDGWASQVDCILPVSDKYYPIQAADLLAGMIGRSRGDADRWKGLGQFMSEAIIHHHVDLYDYAEIVEKYKQG
ncbi:MAG: hypothetical protein WA738_10375 [Candidatus Angelobacter sp.]